MYAVFKFVHIVTVMAWIGGLTGLAVLDLGLARAGGGQLFPAVARQRSLLSARVIGPASGVAFLAGFAVIGVHHTGFPLWVLWGIVAFLVSMVLSGVFLRRAAAQLIPQTEEDGGSDIEIAAARRRVAVLHAVNLLLLLSAVAVMVFKPTL